VIDWSTGIAPAYCAKLLAGAGAEVIKIEPPDGDPWRRWTTSDRGVDPVAGSPLFRFLHAGTRSVIGAPGQDDIEELVAGADIVIDGGNRPLADGSALVDRYRHLVVCAVTPYGTAGPYVDRPVTEFIIQAESGSLLGRGGAWDTPIMAGGRISEWVAGTFAAVATLGAHRRVAAGGPGAFVDVSILEAMTIAGSNYAEVRHALSANAALTGPVRTFETPSIEPTADGYVGFCTNTRQQFDDFLLLIERADLLGDDELASFRGRSARWQEWNDIVHAFTTQHPTADIVDTAAALRIPVAPVLGGHNIEAFPQFVARNIFETSAEGDYRAPRRPWRLDDTDPPAPASAPRLGQHRIDDLDHRTPRAVRDNSALPLAGLRIIDLTAWWAGPVAAGVLAALGAEVIHVESVRRMDGIRMVGGTLGTHSQWWERSPHFLCSNTNKLGLTLDLSHPDGMARLHRLIAVSDAVVENFTPRVLDNFGLTWESIQAINPQCLLVRMPAFGLTGPWRDNTGFAQTMEQITGLAWLTGHRHDQPRIQRGPSDPNAGMHAAFALLAGLAERDRRGFGGQLEVTMVEGALNAAAEIVIEASAHDWIMERDGNRGPNVAPQGLYEAQEDETWLAISVPDDDTWERLVGVLGTPEWTTGMQTAFARRRAHDHLDDALAAWARQRPAEASEALLLAAGVPAAVARDPRTMTSHPQLRARRFYESIEHPATGRFDCPGMPFRLSGVDRWIRSVAPTLGQHTEAILRAHAGDDDETLAALRATGVIGTVPIGL
jgi:crotonobetainyl-CoA:carnitine CoA-transferase CaiB-like acyl-CoA transferase